MEILNPFFEVGVVDEVFVNIAGENVVIPEKKAIVSEGEIISVVGSKYNIIRNDEVQDIFDEVFSEYDLEFHSDHMNSRSSEWRRRYILNGSGFEHNVVENDAVRIMIEIFNSYSGKSSYGFNILAYRLVCENGLRLFKSILSRTFTHLTGMTDKISTTFSKSLSQFPPMIDNYWRPWAAQKLPFELFERFIASRTYLGKKTKSAILDVHQVTGSEASMWDAFNSLTYYETHMIKTRKGSSVFSGNAYKIGRAIQDFYELPIDVQVINERLPQLKEVEELEPSVEIEEVEIIS